MKIEADWSRFRQTLSERKQPTDQPLSEEVVEIRLCAARAIQRMAELRDFFPPLSQGELKVGTW